MRRTLVVGLLTATLAMSAMPVAAQAGEQPDRAMTLRDATQKAAIRLAKDSRQPTLQRAARQSWPRRHPAAFGAVIGAGAGAAFAAIRVSEHDVPNWGFCIPIAGLGSGIGALIGATFGGP